jgi:hypothetical protein
MLTRTHGTINFECDACAEVLDTETRDFEEARAKLRKEEWKTLQIAGVWSHYCTGCEAPNLTRHH